MSEGDRIKVAIIRAQEAVRQKIRELKARKFEEEEFYKTTYAPIVQPLQTLVKRRLASSSAPQPQPAVLPSPPSQVLPATPQRSSPPAALDDLFPYQQSPPAAAAAPLRAEEFDAGDEDGDDECDEPIPKRQYYESDTTFGPYIDAKTGSRKLGRLVYDRDDKFIYVGKDLKFPVTTGLVDLIEAKVPGKSVYTEADKKIYTEQILPATLVHLQGFNPSGNIRCSRNKKYLSVIRDWYHATKDVGGSGGGKKKSIRCRDIRDVNGLCQRLRLLMSSRAAGHTGHTAEIAGIIAQLHEDGYIR